MPRPSPLSGERIGAERAAGDGRHLHVRLHLEVEPVGRVLHGVLFRTVHRHQAGHPAAVGPVHRLVAGVDHRVQRSDLTNGPSGRSAIAAPPARIEGLALLAGRAERPCSRANTCRGRRSRTDRGSNDCPSRRPRRAPPPAGPAAATAPPARIGPRHAHVAVVAAVAPERAGEGLEVEVVACHWRPARRTWWRRGRHIRRARRGRPPRPVPANGSRPLLVAYHRSARSQSTAGRWSGPLPIPDRLRFGLAAGVPDVEQIAHLDHRRRIAARYPGVAANAGDAGVAKAGEEFVARVLQRAPLIVQPVHRRGQRPVGRFSRGGIAGNAATTSSSSRLPQSVRATARSSRCQLSTINGVDHERAHAYPRDRGSANEYGHHHGYFSRHRAGIGGTLPGTGRFGGGHRPRRQRRGGGLATRIRRQADRGDRRRDRRARPGRGRPHGAGTPSAADVLVCNAAINPEPAGRIATIGDLSDDHLSATFDVNVVGVLRTIRAFHPLLAAAGGAKIAVISSGPAASPPPPMVP